MFVNRLVSNRVSSERRALEVWFWLLRNGDAPEQKPLSHNGRRLALVVKPPAAMLLTFTSQRNHSGTEKMNATN